MQRPPNNPARNKNGTMVGAKQKRGTEASRKESKPQCHEFSGYYLLQLVLVGSPHILHNFLITVIGSGFQQRRMSICIHDCVTSVGRSVF